MKKKHKQKIRQQKLPGYTRIPGWIIAVFIAAMPLLSVPIEIILTKAELIVVPGSGGIFGDISQRFREIVLFITGVGLLLFWLGERVFPDHPLPSPLLQEKEARLPLILGGGYLLFAVISAVFSEYGEVSFWGIASESNGVAAVFGYVILFLSAYNWLRGDSRRLLSYGALAAAGIMTVLLAVQMISGVRVAELLYGYPDDNTGLSLLFGNPISCGEFGVLLFPVLMVSGVSEKKTPLRAAYFLAGGVMLCVTFLSRSTTAFVGIAAALLLTGVIVIIGRKGTDRKKLLSLLTALIPVAVMLVVDPAGMLGSIRTQAENRGVYSPDESCHLRDIEIGTDNIVLDCENFTVTVTLTDENTAVITGTDEEILAELHNSNSGVSLDGVYAPMSVTLNERLLKLDLGYADTIEFETTGGTPIYIGLNGYLVRSPSKSAFPELSRYYSFATGRGYIWLSSLPLLGDCIFKGYGAGQFAFYFPQDDIVGMLNTHGTTALCTDKPHSLYLGIGLSHGIPALVIFLCIAAVSLRRSGSLHGSGFLENAPAASVICYLIMGIANDSSVVYSPLFWIFAGAACVPAGSGGSGKVSRNGADSE